MVFGAAAPCPANNQQPARDRWSVQDQSIENSGGRHSRGAHGGERVTAPDELQHALLDRREDGVLDCDVAERVLSAAYDHKVGHVAEALAKLADSFSSER